MYRKLKILYFWSYYLKLSFEGSGLCNFQISSLLELSDFKLLNLSQIILQPLMLQNQTIVYLRKCFPDWNKFSSQNNLHRGPGEIILLSYKQEVWLLGFFLSFFWLFVSFLWFLRGRGVRLVETKVLYLQWPKETMQQLGHGKGRAIYKFNI